MSEDVWSEQGTSPDSIEAALRDLLRERHAADHALAPARVLNLVVVVDREWKGEISNRLEGVGRYHGSRTILCAVEDGRTQLDAVAAIAYGDGADASGRVVREWVEVDLGPKQLAHLDTVLDPVLVSELPTMLWSPHGHREAVQSLLPLTDVILLDSDSYQESETDRPLARADKLGESVYVVDLAWLRTTPWRERLASSFDMPARADALAQLTGVHVRHHPSSLPSAALLAGWLASRLGWETAPLEPSDGDGWRGTARDQGREIEIALVSADQEVPGLAGVTVSWDGEHSLSLDRGPGGLHAVECRAGEEEHTWRVLGASRGEAGILGEGVRQALLRDSTYPLALDTALLLRGLGAPA